MPEDEKTTEGTDKKSTDETLNVRDRNILIELDTTKAAYDALVKEHEALKKSYEEIHTKIEQDVARKLVAKLKGKGFRKTEAEWSQLPISTLETMDQVSEDLKRPYAHVRTDISPDDEETPQNFSLANKFVFGGDFVSKRRRA